MNKFIKENYIFLIIFILFLFKDSLYQFINIKENIKTNIECEILKKDYNKLLEFNNIDMVYNNQFTNSYIIYKDIYNYLESITIRGGSNNNFYISYPVIYNNTLIGIISKVKENSSIVKLITNKNSKISVKINEEVGVLEYSDGKLIVSNISNYSEIKVNDKIYTSGFGNIRENIYIGSVKNIKLDNKGIEKSIEVNYNIDIKNIYYVSVLGESKWFFYLSYLTY